MTLRKRTCQGKEIGCVQLSTLLDRHIETNLRRSLANNNDIEMENRETRDNHKNFESLGISWQLFNNNRFQPLMFFQSKLTSVHYCDHFKVYDFQNNEILNFAFIYSS